MKTFLPENDDFLNCTVLESLLVAGVCIVNSIILQDSTTAQFNVKTSPVSESCQETERQ